MESMNHLKLFPLLVILAACGYGIMYLIIKKSPLWEGEEFARNYSKVAAWAPRGRLGNRMCEHAYLLRYKEEFSMNVSLGLYFLLQVRKFHANKVWVISRK